MHLRLRYFLCAIAMVLLTAGAVRSLMRGAPITADWGGLGFVTAMLLLMVLGITTTCACILSKASNSRASRHEP